MIGQKEVNKGKLFRDWLESRQLEKKEAFHGLARRKSADTRGALQRLGRKEKSGDSLCIGRRVSLSSREDGELGEAWGEAWGGGVSFIASKAGNGGHFKGLEESAKS